MLPVSEPVVLSQMVLDCNRELEQAYRLMTNALISGCQDKLAILQAAESFEMNYHLCCDIADRCVATAINLDTGATQGEREVLRARVQGIQRRWSEMLFHVESGLWLFGVVQHAGGGVH